LALAERMAAKVANARINVPAAVASDANTTQSTVARRIRIRPR
jgi:hypothetical protein